MFEVQWWAKANEVWAFRASYDSQAKAEFKSDASAAHFRVAHRVVDHATGRVVAVFGSTGKRLTFPIATAIAYTALAHSALQLAREEYRELAQKLEEVEDEKREVQALADELMEDWRNRTC